MGCPALHIDSRFSAFTPKLEVVRDFEYLPKLDVAPKRTTPKKVFKYYPYGMLMPGRFGNQNTSNYRYGFQGQEKDDEIKGKGNSVNYKYRMHDPRLGRFFAVDPLSASYPHNSPYAFSENEVIAFVELEGLEKGEITLNQEITHDFDGKNDLVILKTTKHYRILKTDSKGVEHTIYTIVIHSNITVKIDSDGKVSDLSTGTGGFITIPLESTTFFDENHFSDNDFTLDELPEKYQSKIKEVSEFNKTHRLSEKEYMGQSEQSRKDKLTGVLNTLAVASAAISVKSNFAAVAVSAVIWYNTTAIQKGYIDKINTSPLAQATTEQVKNEKKKVDSVGGADITKEDVTSSKK